MVKITGKDIKEGIPDTLTLSVESIHVINKKLASVELTSEHGSVTVIVWRKAASFLLYKNVNKSLKKEENTPSAQKDSEEDPSNGVSEEGNQRQKGLYVGKIRYDNGRKQRLTGFTDNGSDMTRPSGVLKRTRHPETDTLVWPLWENVLR